MLLASLSILAGAIVWMPVLFPVFGEAGSPGIFGPVFALGARVTIVIRALISVVVGCHAPNFEGSGAICSFVSYKSGIQQ